MTPESTCVGICDLALNEVKTVKNAKYQKCVPLTLAVTITCKSCDKVVNKTDGTVTIVQNPMKNLKLEASKSSGSAGVFVWTLNNTYPLVNGAVLKDVQISNRILKIPAGNA